MAYGDNNLSADHQWSFNNTLVDTVETADVVNNGGVLSATPICRDVTHSYQVNGRTDTGNPPNRDDINNLDHESRAVGGWFMVSQIQGPPCSIYKEGGTTHNIAILIWAGNNLIFQSTVTGGNDLQIFSDVDLIPNRPYHLLLKFSGSGQSNEVSAYLDGVKQLSADPSSREPGFNILPAHTGFILFGNIANDILIGGSATLTRACVNGFYNQWLTWSGADSEALNDTNIRQVLFEEGALADVIIASDTEANMQLAIDALASTVRPDYPLCIRVDEVSGGGDLNLSADNITFNPRASIHVRYEGTGTLNWTNTNGANASIGSGNVNFINPSQLTITDLINPSEVRVFEAGTTNEVAGQEDVTTGTFTSTISASNVDIRIVSLTYQVVEITNLDMSNDVSFSAGQIFDRQYENL
jgi:hypothetical protein